METLNNIVLTIQNYMSNYVLIIALLGAPLVLVQTWVYSGKRIWRRNEKNFWRSVQ